MGLRERSVGEQQPLALRIVQERARADAEQDRPAFVERAQDREEDIMDKAFDVKSNSRLGCQSKILRDTTIVAEISRGSRQAYLDEYPELRKPPR